MERLIYSFNEDAGSRMAELGELGNSLAEMTKMGIPVPFGFNVSERFHQEYKDNSAEAFEALFAEMGAYIEDLEKVAGKVFGSDSNPLFLAVRSALGGKTYGLTDAVLNVGFNDITVEALGRKTGDLIFAYKNYLYFLRSYGCMIRGITEEMFYGCGQIDTDVDLSEMQAMVEQYKGLILRETGMEFPQDPYVQLRESMEAVLNSDTNLGQLMGELGVSANGLIPITVQMMVYGNLNERSGAGAVYSRNPITGAKFVFGDFASMTQGDAISSGSGRMGFFPDMASLMPETYGNLIRIIEILEDTYGDMQLIKFAVEDGRLYILHRSDGDRSTAASVRIAMDFLEGSRIDEDTAIMRIDPEKIGRILYPIFSSDELELKPFITNGSPTSAGIASGRIFCDYNKAEIAKRSGDAVIFVADECSEHNIHEVFAFDGVLAKRGGSTSMSAIFARHMHYPLINGCDVRYNADDKTVNVGMQVLNEGDIVSIDASTGSIYLGEIKRQFPPITPHFSALMKMADKIKDISIMATAETPDDVKAAMSMGAAGIGIYRTAGVLAGPEIRDALRAMDQDVRGGEIQDSADKIYIAHKEDFSNIFKILDDREVTIMLLDLPDGTMSNPGSECDLSGLCGARIGIFYPYILELQAKAVFDAALEIFAEKAIIPEIKILIPAVGLHGEFKKLRAVIDTVASECFMRNGKNISYAVGSMVDVPRGAVIAGRIAELSDFIIFDANSLTRFTFGVSKDCADMLDMRYASENIYDFNPFVRIDEEGVGALIRFAMRNARNERSNIKFGLCGEVLANPKSVKFCNDIDINYISASPYKLFSMRLSAAQAEILSASGMASRS